MLFLVPIIGAVLIGVSAYTAWRAVKSIYPDEYDYELRRTRVQPSDDDSGDDSGDDLTGRAVRVDGNI